MSANRFARNAGPPDPTAGKPTPFTNQHRAALAAAIAARDEERQCHAALEAALERAKDDRRAAADRLREAEAALRHVKADNATRVAYAFLNREPDVDAVGPAEVAVEQTLAEVSRATQIEEALAHEIEVSQTRVTNLRAPLKQALANVITTSPQFLALFDQRDAAWQWLRTLIVLFQEIQHALDGYMPEHMRISFSGVEPLEKGVSHFDGEKLVPYNWDRDLVATWEDALSELQHNAAASLPGSDDS